MGNTEGINIKNYWFFNALLMTWSISKNLTQIYEINRQKVIQKHLYLLHWIDHSRKIGDYENIHSVNSLYLIICEVDGYIEKSNGDKYLVFASRHKNKEVLTKFTKLWVKIEYQIRTINGGESSEYGKNFMEIRFESDDNLPLSRTIKLRMLTVTVRSVFEEDGNYYPQLL